MNVEFDTSYLSPRLSAKLFVKLGYSPFHLLPSSEIPPHTGLPIFSSDTAIPCPQSQPRTQKLREKLSIVKRLTGSDWDGRDMVWGIGERGKREEERDVCCKQQIV
jgi:hypothetical protein